MDKNLVALLHTQTSLMFALASTHENPAALAQAFAFHLQQTQNTLPEASEVPGLVNVWAATFRMHFGSARERHADEGGIAPPPE